MTYPVPSPAHNEAPISINFKIPEIPGSPMLTLRASQGAELDNLSADVARHAAGIGKSLTEVRAGMLAGAGVQDAPQAPTQGAYAPPPANVPTTPIPAPQAPAQPHYQAPPQTGGMGQAPTCPHGERVYKSGVSKAGKPYKMWACPEPQGPSQCKPEWAS